MAAELWRVAGVLAAALVVGAAVDHVLLALWLATLAYLGAHLWSLARVRRWLADGRGIYPPPAWGLWDELLELIFRLRQRSRSRKRRLAGLLERFRDAAAAMPDGAVVLRDTGEIEWLNDAAARLLGLRAPQDFGRRIHNLVRHPAFVRYLEGGEWAEPVEIPSPVDDAVQLSVQLIVYGDNQRLLIARDVTRVKKLEAMRRDFVANVSHELRTPVTVLVGYLEALEEDEACARRWSRPLALMREQAARMRRIVDDLLMLSRLETEDAAHRPRLREAVDVPALLARIVAEARALSGPRRHRISLDAEQGLGLLGNESELASAFSNLVVNAVQYTPEGGEIRVRWWHDAAGAHLAVSDTGIGIAHEHIPRLTERFYRVDVARSRATGGTGLGLAIVKHVLARHEAALSIESVQGRGSTFRCDFPPERIVRPDAAGDGRRGAGGG